jgi:hypothetical protein
VRALPLRGLNVKDVVWAHTLIMTRPALDAANAALAPANDKRRLWASIAPAAAPASA